MITPESRIVITGANGMVGKALLKELKKHYKNVIGLTRADCDLEDRTSTLKTFSELKPDLAFLLAAKVGGIKANMQDPVGFLKSNTLITCHSLEACHLAKVKKSLLLGSSCIYPKDSPQPMKEEYLLQGPLEPTNEAYALAKIMGLKLAKYYNSQYGMNIVCPMPSNIYGPGDTYDLERSHVVSALVRRFVDARDSNSPTLTLWGTGRARRELLHVNDLVRALLFFVNKVDSVDFINVGPGKDITIKDLSLLIAKNTNYTGEIEWDESRPDGMPRKCLDTSLLSKLGFQTEVDIEDGIKDVIQDYEQIKSKMKEKPL